MAEDNDRYLVWRLKNGENEAFRELVSKYRSKAFGIAYNYVHNVEDAKELSQEAFVKVYRSIKNFNEKSSFFTWFYRLLINVCLDFRKKKRLPTISFSQFEQNNEYDGANTADWVEDKQINEIAAILQKSEGTVKSLLHRGLGRMRKLME